MRVYGEQLRTGTVNPAEDQSSTDMTLMPVGIRNGVSPYTCIHVFKSSTNRNSICFSIVIAVTTLGFRPVDSACNSMFDEIRAVVNSVSAAVPAPQHRIDSVM